MNYCAAATNGALAHTHNQVAGLIACVCKYTVGTVCMHVAAQNGALVHTHNQVAGLIACVSKYTAG